MAIAFVLILSLRGISNFWTNYLWFDSLDRVSVWSAIIQAKLGMFAVFFGVFFGLLMLNLWIAQRIAPAIRPLGPEEDLLEQYHELVGDKDRYVRFGSAFLFSVMVAWNVPSHWNKWLLFRNRVDFGVDDPQFNTDIGFYIFELPFLSYVVSWLFSAVVAALLITMIAHYINGGIRMRNPGDRATPAVKAHLSVLLALLALIKAADYYLQRFELTVSTRGVVDGATYTDVNAQLPAIQLLMLISGFAVVLLLANIRWRGWTLPALAVGLWAFVAIVMGGIYPAVVQRFQVDPNETNREALYTTRNIEATRAAYGLDNVDRRTFEYDDSFVSTVDNAVLAENADLLNDVRLMDPRIMGSTFQNLQGDRGFYQFPKSLDTDRYVIDGELTPVVVGARELDLTTQNAWENEHVAFTHGYGVAIAQGDTVGVSGRPEFLAADIPLKIEEELGVEIDQPQLYYSEGLSSYSVVGATRDEIDFTDDTGQERLIRYDGTGGVTLDSFFRKVAFSMRFGQIDPLISEFVTEESKVLFHRNVTDRAKNLAPFLQYDSDPYPVVIDGRVHYVIDGYTTSDRYPYAQRASQGSGQPNTRLASRSNYIRNSVKSVVDAYDGDVKFYLTPNLEDPIIEAYMNAFPGLILPADQMPDDLADHLRFPQELFTIQTNMWGQYQLPSEQPEAFLSASAAWIAAQDPGIRPDVGNTITTQTLTGEVETVARIDPYYAVQVLPGETEERFVALRSFVPRPQPDRDERRELTAVVVADSSAEDYGKLIEYRMGSSNVPGPLFVASRIAANTEVSRENTLLDDQGSQVLFGEFQLIPMGKSILYVRPMYVQAEGDSAVPELRQVIVSMDGEVAMGTSFGKALDLLFGTTNGERVVESSSLGVTVPPPTSDDTDDADEPDPDRSELLSLLIELFEIENDRAADADERAERLREQIAEQYRLEGQEVPSEFLPPTTTTTIPPEESSPDTTVEPEPEPA